MRYRAQPKAEAPAHPELDAALEAGYPARLLASIPVEAWRQIKREIAPACLVTGYRPILEGVHLKLVKTDSIETHAALALATDGRALHMREISCYAYQDEYVVIPIEMIKLFDGFVSSHEKEPILLYGQYSASRSHPHSYKPHKCKIYRHEIEKLWLCTPQAQIISRAIDGPAPKNMAEVINGGEAQRKHVQVQMADLERAIKQASLLGSGSRFKLTEDDKLYIEPVMLYEHSQPQKADAPLSQEDELSWEILCWYARGGATQSAYDNNLLLTALRAIPASVSSLKLGLPQNEAITEGWQKGHSRPRGPFVLKANNGLSIVIMPLSLY